MLVGWRRRRKIVKKINWDFDAIHDAETILQSAQELWEAQCFKKPTENNRDKIVILLHEAISELKSIIAEIS